MWIYFSGVPRKHVFNVFVVVVPKEDQAGAYCVGDSISTFLSIK